MLQYTTKSPVWFLSYCLGRHLYDNQITSIANGAFTGLGNLTHLYKIMHRRSPTCLVIRHVGSCTTTQSQRSQVAHSLVLEIWHTCMHIIVLSTPIVHHSFYTGAWIHYQPRRRHSTCCQELRCLNCMSKLILSLIVSDSVCSSFDQYNQKMKGKQVFLSWM